METWKNIAAGIVGLIILYYTFNKKRSATVQVVVVVAVLGAAYYFWFYEEKPKQPDLRQMGVLFQDPLGPARSTGPGNY